MGIRVLIASAGTGGHIYPAIAVADFLVERGADVLFVTSDRGEGSIIRGRGYRCEELSYRGLHRKFCIENIKRLIKISLAFISCYSLIKDYKPDVVLGMGGYGEVPAVLAARLAGIPSVIHEQDVMPGLSTRALAPLANKITLSYEETLSFLRWKVVNKCVVTGNPVRREILSLIPGASKDRWGFEGKRVLLAFGGSLGAKRINDAVLGLLDEPEGREIFKEWGIILITGKEDFLRVSEKVGSYKDVSQGIRVLPYADDMASVYGAADLVLSRAGASTVAELRALGLPAILVPYPHSTGNHQLFNAKLLEKDGQAMVIRDEELSSQNILKILKSKLLRKMPPRKVESAQAIGEVVLNLA